MYKPSDAIIEQIAREYYNAFFERKMVLKDYDSLLDECKIINLPTIRKALELYENQPQWKDKPDKTGWWWVFSLYVRGDPLIFPLYPIHILFCDGELHADTSYPEEFPSISNYIKTLSNPKWLYIPEPYKGEE